MAVARFNVSFDMPLAFDSTARLPTIKTYLVGSFLRLIKITTANNHRSYRANYLN